jgi:hypothetical protein
MSKKKHLNTRDFKGSAMEFEDCDDEAVQKEAMRHERVKKCLAILEEMQYGKGG